VSRRSARELAVPVPTTLTSRCDCFIDNIMQVFLDSPDNRHRQPAILPPAVFATVRPHAGDAEPSSDALSCPLRRSRPKVPRRSCRSSWGKNCTRDA
jgi:hypothetical protein